MDKKNEKRYIHRGVYVPYSYKQKTEDRYLSVQGKEKQVGIISCGLFHLHCDSS